MISLREDIAENEKRNALNALSELLELKSVGKKRRAAPQYILRNNVLGDVSRIIANGAYWLEDTADTLLDIILPRHGREPFSDMDYLFISPKQVPKKS